MGVIILKVFNDFVAQYGATVLYTIITAVIGYLGIVIKNMLKRHFAEKEKREIVKNAVSAVEQCCCDKHGEQKLNEATESVKKLLSDRKINASETEIRVLIESALAKQNDAFHK